MSDPHRSVLAVRPEVSAALAAGRAVVALLERNARVAARIARALAGTAAGPPGSRGG